jgi:hypothetical protein
MGGGIDMRILGLPLWQWMTDMVAIADDAEGVSMLVENGAHADLFQSEVPPTPSTPSNQESSSADGDGVGGSVAPDMMLKDRTTKLGGNCTCELHTMPFIAQRTCRTHLHSSLNLVNIVRMSRGMRPIVHVKDYEANLLPMEHVNRVRTANGLPPRLSVEEYEASIKMAQTEASSKHEVSEEALPKNDELSRATIREGVKVGRKQSSNVERFVGFDPKVDGYNMVRCTHASIPDVGDFVQIMETEIKPKPETVEMRRARADRELHLECTHCFENTGLLPECLMGESGVNVYHTGTLYQFACQFLHAMCSLLVCNMCRPHYATLTRGFLFGDVLPSMKTPSSVDPTMRPVTFAEPPREIRDDTRLIDATHPFMKTSFVRVPIDSSAITPIINDNPRKYAIPMNGHMADIDGAKDIPEDLLITDDEDLLELPKDTHAGYNIDSRLANMSNLQKYIWRLRCIVGWKQEHEKYEYLPEWVVDEKRQMFGYHSSPESMWSNIIMMAYQLPNFGEASAWNSTSPFSQHAFPNGNLSSADEYIMTSTRDAIVNQCVHLSESIEEWRSERESIVRERINSFRGNIELASGAAGESVSKEDIESAKRYSFDTYEYQQQMWFRKSVETCGEFASLNYETNGADRRAFLSMLEACSALVFHSPKYQSMTSFLWPLPDVNMNAIHAWLIIQEWDWATESDSGNPRLLLDRLTIHARSSEFRREESEDVGAGMNLIAEYEVERMKKMRSRSGGGIVRMRNEWLMEYVKLMQKHYFRMMHVVVPKMANPSA